MQQTIHLFCFLFFTSFLSAQNFSVSADYASLQGSCQSEIGPRISLKNESKQNITLIWEQNRNLCPDGWEVAVCDRQCYSSLVQKKQINLKPQESLDNFRVNFRPNGKEGIGNLEIKIYEKGQPQDAQTVLFSASAKNEHSAQKMHAAKAEKPTVYPNPVVEHLMLRDAAQQVQYLEIYNVVGRKLLQFQVNGQQDKFDVSSLPRGIYMLRMLDENRHIIRTERISKYNP